MIVTRGLDSGGLRPAEQGALGLRPAHNAGCKGSLERQIFSKICLDCSRSQERTALRALDLPIEPPGTVISPAPPSAPAFRDYPVQRFRAIFPPTPH